MPSSAQVRTEAAERRAKALQLRLAGVSFEGIGQQLGGVSAPRAYQIYQAALKQIVQEPAEELIRVESERLDLLWRAMITKALAGNARAAEVALHIGESRRRLLGLDAPAKSTAKLDVHVHEGIDEEIEELLGRMRDLDPAAG